MLPEKMPSPLGKYANAAALIASIGTLTTWLLVSVMQSLSIGTGPTDQLNMFAVLAIGVLIGNGGMITQAQTIASEKLNGQRAALVALHKRLDEAGIPPAKDGN